MEDDLLTSITPRLTIAIPTWQRARFLALTLAQLQREIETLPLDARPALVEVLISDNGSADETPVVVAAAQEAGLVLRYVRNPENIGSDANIAQCFNLALGQYVLILGDDDLFVDGALGWLLQTLARRTWGVVCLRPYGFEKDFRREHPGGSGADLEFGNGGDFLAAIGALLTLISSCVINKQILGELDANQFCGSNLVQVHLVVRAALEGGDNLFASRYLMACQRNNSGGYDFSQVFVFNLGQVLDSYQTAGLSPAAIRRLETRLLLAFHPFYLFRQRLSRSGDRAATAARFTARFGDRCLYRLWVAPILWLPRPLALSWGAGVTLVGRMLNGELRRGITFAWNRLRR